MIRRELASEELREGGFTASAFTDESNGFTAVNGQRSVTDRFYGRLVTHSRSRNDLFTENSFEAFCNSITGVLGCGSLAFRSRCVIPFTPTGRRLFLALGRC